MYECITACFWHEVHAGQHLPIFCNHHCVENMCSDNVHQSCSQMILRCQQSSACLAALVNRWFFIICFFKEKKEGVLSQQQKSSSDEKVGKSPNQIKAVKREISWGCGGGGGGEQTKTLMPSVTPTKLTPSLMSKQEDWWVSASRLIKWWALAEWRDPS